jgi:ABC-type iron transport system FetAB ATPase subunit
MSIQPPAGSNHVAHFRNPFRRSFGRFCRYNPQQPAARVANASNAILQFDGSVAAGDVVTFLGGTGTVALSSSTISGNELGGFAGTIAGLAVATGTGPTNEIDLANIAKASITSADVNGTTLTVNTTGGSFNLQLANAPAAGTDVVVVSDGRTGSDLYLGDLDAGEQAALKLTVIGNSATPVGAAGAGSVAFTVSGLDPEDIGTVTFTDINGKSFQVNVTGGQTSYMANLSSLADGTITSSLAINTDAAGNSFTLVSANNVSLDQDGGETPTLSFVNTLVGSAGAKTVTFTVGGIDPSDDTAVISFKDQNGKTTTATVTTTGTATADLSMLADGPITASMVVTDTAKNTFNVNSSNSASLDQDTGEQAALKLTVNGNLATPIGAAGASKVAFTVAWLDPEDNGTVTFSDGTNKVTVNVNGSQTDYTANLTLLADGTITSSLSVNADAAGNTFAPVAGNSVSLDRDAGEQAALKLTVNGGDPISAAIAVAVPFTVVGIESDDNGTMSFSDGSHAPVLVNIVNGVLSATTVNLSALNDGMITATLHLTNDAAGNTFTNVVTNATLDQDKVAEAPTVTAPSALTVAAGGSVPLGIVIKATDSDDVLSVAVSGVPKFESVSAAGATPTITKQGSTYTYKFSALPTSDWNNGLILTSTYGGKGHPTNALTVSVSNTTADESSTAPSKTISVTDPPAGSSGGGLGDTTPATSAPLTISLSDPPVHHQTLGSLIHQHAAHLDLIEQLHTHLANPDLLLLRDHEGHDGSNKLSYSSPGIQDTALLAAATHRMIEAMASFEANPAGIVSPLVNSHEPTISDHLAIGSPGHHGG